MTKRFWDQKTFKGPNIFCRFHMDFHTQIIFSGPKIYFKPNFFSDPQFYSDPIFLDPKVFFRHKNISDLKFFSELYFLSNAKLRDLESYSHSKLYTFVLSLVREKVSQHTKKELVTQIFITQISLF